MTVNIADFVELKLVTSFDPNNDTTLDVVCTSTINTLNKQKASSNLSDFRLTLIDKTDTSQRLRIGVESVATNGTLSGFQRYTLTIKNSDSANPMIGLANDDDGTNADANIISGNVSGLTITEFSADSPVLLTVGSAEYNGLLTTLNTATASVATVYRSRTLFSDAQSVTVGDGRWYIRIPEGYTGRNLSSVKANVITAGTTGTTDIQIHNVTDGVDMLSTKLTIDSGETDSTTAATPAVIDTANDDVVTNDILRVDIDAVSTTAPLGLIVELGFTL